jgi:hypothetical protein
VGGYFDGNAGLIDFPETTVAFPSTAGRIQIAIRSHLYGDAGVLDIPKSTVALPATTEGCICRVRIRRNFDGNAASFDFSIPPITRPSAPIFLGVRILRHPGGIFHGGHIAGGRHQKPDKSHCVNNNVQKLSFVTHGLFLFC